MPLSGLVVRPKVTTPVARMRSKIAELRLYFVLANNRDPLCDGKSTDSQPKSFSKNGRPRNGPRGRPWAMERRATSSCIKTTAFRAGLTAATLARAASSSSFGVTSPLATMPASAVASCARKSIMPNLPSYAIAVIVAAATRPVPFACAALMSHSAQGELVCGWRNRDVLPELAIRPKDQNAVVSRHHRHPA